MMKTILKKYSPLSLLLPLLLSVACSTTAQAPAGLGGSSSDPQSAQSQAPIDLTGNWVSLVTEDWRFRMLTAPAGDYEGIPLSQAGQELANSWDASADQGCLAYGVGGLMRRPTRLQVSWQSENTLSIETDAGQQTRLLKFGSEQDGTGAGSLQGVSNASWNISTAGGFGSPVVGGTLDVDTSDMAMGYFRSNGVPYSEQSTLSEYFELLHQDDGSEYLVVISILNDPVYMTAPVITSTNFKREADASSWSPSACE